MDISTLHIISYISFIKIIIIIFEFHLISYISQTHRTWVRVRLIWNTIGENAFTNQLTDWHWQIDRTDRHAWQICYQGKYPPHWHITSGSYHEWIYHQPSSNFISSGKPPSRIHHQGSTIKDPRHTVAITVANNQSLADHYRTDRDHNEWATDFGRQQLE